MADASQALGDSAAAERRLLLALVQSPTLSWTPYANLASFALARGDADLAARRLEDGLAFFPRSRDLRQAQARLAVLRHDEGKAVQVLSLLVAENPTDGTASLALLDLQAPRLSPEQYRVRLWKIFDRVPSDRGVFSALSGALIAMHDWEGAGIALGQHEAAAGPPDSGVLLVKGLVAAMEGNDAAALDAFRRSASLARDGRARFDAALVLLRGGNARSALAELAGAEDEITRHGGLAEKDEARARIALAVGSAYLLDGDRGGARTALARAIALDPKNLRAGLLMRKLEAEDHQ
jgi:Flp pilus assembly protein TadD